MTIEVPANYLGFPVAPVLDKVVSVSQDMSLRKSIRESVIEQSKLLHNIGTAEIEKRVEKQVLSMAAKTSKAMAEIE